MNNCHQTTPRRRPTWLVAALGGAVLALAACASPTPPPTAQMAVANAAVAHAAAAGSAEYAPAELAMARDKMARANVALAARDHDAAMTLAQQAQLDAQVAEAKTEAEKARKAAVAMQEAGRALREEMARQPR